MCLAGKGGKEGQWGLGKELESGAVDLSKGPARVEVHSYVQRATNPSKRIANTLKYVESTPHSIINRCVLFVK
jgi:hypothetical protein